MYSINKFQFVAMRAKGTSPVARLNQEHMHHKPKRQFLVQEHRVQFDDYMLKQVKKNRKSVKRIKKTVELLRTQMDQLKDQNRRQRNEYEQLTQQMKTIRRQLSEPHMELTSRRSPKGNTVNNCLHKTRKQLAPSRDSSFSLRSSGMEQTHAKSAFSKVKTRSVRQEGSSKTILKRKIEALKERAHVIKQNAVSIKQELHRKIQSKLQHLPKKHHQQDYKQEHNDSNAYEQLMQLLKTNKRIQQPTPPIRSPQLPSSKQQISINQQAHLPNYSDKSMPSTNRDPTPLKNSAVVNYHAQPKQPSQLASQTYLLQSDRNIVAKPKRTLQLSRCINVRVSEASNEEAYQGQQFSGILRECKASGSQLSFQGPDNEQQLKELQFQFDQLVRQQLMSNQPKEKQALGKAIRSLLQRIAVLKQQLQQSR